MDTDTGNPSQALKLAADSMKKSSEITEDENHDLHEEVQKLLKEHENKVTELQEKKSKEIMEV